MKESVYQTKVKNYCKKRGAYVENIWGGGFQSAGIPDLIGCYRGIFFGIELKVGKNKPSALQKAKNHLINDAGGVAIVCWNSLEPVKEMFDFIDARVKRNFNYTKKFYYNGGIAK